MTLSELKAFIEGMDVQDAPTPDQWARITDKLAQTQPLQLTAKPSYVTPGGYSGGANLWTYVVTSCKGAA